MGQDKALLPVQGVPLLQRTCLVAQACTPWVTVITPWPERYQAIVPAGVRQLREPAAGAGQSAPRSRGPLHGFYQGLTHLQTNPKADPADWILLLACDLPHLDVSVLIQWQQQLDQVPAAAIASLSPTAKGWEPLCGFYRRRCLSSLADYLASGQRACQTWLAQETVAAYPAVPPAMLFNCNTPTDWQLTQANSDGNIKVCNNFLR